MTTTASASDVFHQLAGLVVSDIFQNALPVITNALAAVQANPQEVLNPLNSGLFAAQFIANITATLPAIEASSVQGAVTLLQALLTALNAKVTAAGNTPAAVGAEIAANI